MRIVRVIKIGVMPIKKQDKKVNKMSGDFYSIIEHESTEILVVTTTVQFSFFY